MRRNKAIILSKDIGTKICIKFVLVQGRVQDFYHQGQIKFLGEKAEVFLSGAESWTKCEKKTVPLLKNLPPMNFFHQGHKHTFVNFIRGICPLCPTARHASVLVRVRLEVRIEV